MAAPITTPIASRWACAVVGCESLDERPDARDRCCHNRITKLYLGPHDELVLKERGVGGQAKGVKGCKTEGNSDDQTANTVSQ